MDKIEGIEINGFIKEHNFNFIGCENNECIIDAPITDSSLNPYNIAHGGFIFGLMDTCSGLHVLMETKRKAVTTSSSINYLNPGIGSKLIAKSTPIKIGTKLCVMKVEAYNDKEELVATGIFNYLYIE